MRLDKKFYWLTVKDIQAVAEEEFGRKLSSQEIDEIVDAIGDRISRYDAIQYTIKDKLKLEKLD